MVSKKGDNIMEWLDALVKVITSVGFPIVVTGFLLWERMTTTKELIKAISQLTDMVSRLNDKLD